MAQRKWINPEDQTEVLTQEHADRAWEIWKRRAKEASNNPKSSELRIRANGAWKRFAEIDDLLTDGMIHPR